MGIKEILSKLTNMNKPQYDKITPDEMELQSYMREEQRDNIKKQLAYYRMKKNKEIIIGNTFVDQARAIHGNKSILDAEDVFNKRGTNMFCQPATILGQGMQKKRRRR